MANAIERLSGSGLTVGHAGLGVRGTPPAVGKAQQQVHDGDTVTARALGNFGVRFLGIDAAEASFPLPGDSEFVPIKDPEGRWEAFLSDPFAASLPPITPALKPPLLKNLQARVGPGAADNHAKHSDAARKALIAAVEADRNGLGQTEDEFAFFLAFASEIMDGEGRLLAYVNRDQPENVAERPLSYNERLLEQGLVTPYFIWPNVDPFRRAGAVVDAVPKPGTQAELAAKGSLGRARDWVKQSRKHHVGIYDAKDPLRVYPFELRFLARREAPTRWLINLMAHDNRLIPPQKYYTVAHAEDRLWVPDEYLALWVEKGWRRGR
jgi:hypothetical protein